MIIPHWYYVDYLTQFEGDRRQLDWDILKTIKAIKREDFNGFVKLKNASGQSKKFNSSNGIELADSLLENIGKNHLYEAIDRDLSIVPIPNSNMALGKSGPFQIVECANSLLTGYNKSENKAHNVSIQEALVWKQPKIQTHKQSGFRSPDAYDGMLALAEDISQPVLLFDDVYTSGSQAKACASFLTSNGIEVVGVITFAKTINVQRDRPNQWRQDDCEFDDDGFLDIFDI